MIRSLKSTDIVSKFRASLYIVTVECHQKVWKLMMCQPQGWKPQNEIYHADLYFIEKREWPSLIVCEEGILYPKYRGKLVIS